MCGCDSVCACIYIHICGWSEIQRYRASVLPSARPSFIPSVLPSALLPFPPFRNSFFLWFKPFFPRFFFHSSPLFSYILVTSFFFLSGCFLNAERVRRKFDKLRFVIYPFPTVNTRTWTPCLRTFSCNGVQKDGAVLGATSCDKTQNSRVVEHP